MKKITYYCDRCGKQIEDKVYQFSTTIFDSMNKDTEEGAELCGECYDGANDLVWSYIDGYRKTPVNTAVIDEKKEEVKAPVKKEPANRKKLDLGKIAALRRAGWSYKKIADEVGVSPQTIANHMKEAEAWLKEHQGDQYASGRFVDAEEGAE